MVTVDTVNYQAAMVKADAVHGYTEDSWILATCKNFLIFLLFFEQNQFLNAGGETFHVYWNFWKYWTLKYQCRPLGGVHV